MQPCHRSNSSSMKIYMESQTRRAKMQGFTTYHQMQAAKESKYGLVLLQCQCIDFVNLSFNFRRCNANYKKQITKRQRDMLLSRPCIIAYETWLYNVIGDFVSDSRFSNKVLLPNSFSPAENLWLRYHNYQVIS